MEADVYSIVDTMMGSLNFLRVKGPVATAEINIEHLGELKEEEDYVLFLNCDKFDGRNLYPTGTLYDSQGVPVKKYTSRWAKVPWNFMPVSLPKRKN